jgi:membrane-bound inhibitor of C-type lysozyme
MKYLIALVVLFILVVGVLFAMREHAAAPTEPTASTPAPIATAVYSCDDGKSISAAFFEGEQATSTPGEIPTPTGSVEVSLDGQASTTLHQTISADGARYATADDSFVFWNKGNEALIMRNNSMDLDYTNCTDMAATRG